MSGARPQRKTRAWIALGGVLIALLAVVRVTVTDPRVHVRWTEGVGPADRAALERQHGLRDGTPVDETTWRYGLSDLSPENIRDLIQDPAVVDTAYIDRDGLSTEGRGLRVTVWYPYSDLLDRPSHLLRLHRSLWLLLAGGVMLWASRASSRIRRRNLTVAALLVVGLLGAALPFEPSFVMMGGSADHVSSRADFESWFGGRVRFEKHLSQVLLLEVYERLEPTEAAPERAVMAMTRAATVWFLLSALAIGVLEGWSAVVLRYIALALLAPSALLYFGWRELGYLSLNVAAFPLIARALEERQDAGSGGPSGPQGSGRLEAGSAIAGLGAALHGSGLVSLAGVWLAAMGVSGRPGDRAGRLLRAMSWGTAAYVGWVALYVIVLQMSISPDAGAATFSSWRPWAEGDLRLGRFAAPILSATGARDLSLSAWIVGAPLILVAGSLWRRYPHVVRTALWYLPPSILFLVFRWPFEGVGGGMDLVVAGFPALYALAWVCAHDPKRTAMAAGLLVSAHYAFWLVVLDDRFVP